MERNKCSLSGEGILAMARQPNKSGGGAQTNANGLLFEQTTSLDAALAKAGYMLMGRKVYDNGVFIGLSVQKYSLYTVFLEPHGVNYKKYNSKKWLPDECFINNTLKTAFIIEKKFQNAAGSVDEKLPGCHFKKLEYEKLFNPIGYKVEYLYVFNDWFLDERYRDTLEYIEKMGCKYYFNYIPLDFLGL